MNKKSIKMTPVELNQIRIWIRGSGESNYFNNPFIVVGFVEHDKVPYVRVRYLKNCVIRDVYKTDISVNSCAFDSDFENKENIPLDTIYQQGYAVSDN